MKNVRHVKDHLFCDDVFVEYEDEHGRTRRSWIDRGEFEAVAPTTEAPIKTARSPDPVHPVVQAQRALVGEAAAVGLTLEDVDALIATVGADRARELVRSHGRFARLEAVAETVYARRRAAVTGG